MATFPAVAVERLFGDINAVGTTRALIVMRDGVVEIERYGPNTDADTTLPSWSMAKSMLHAAIGVAGIDPASTIDAPEWEGRNVEITLDDLLRMRSGLEWNEEYEPDRPSDVIEMLFTGDVADMAEYAAAKPQAAAPGSSFVYSSGTTNIASRALSDHLDRRGDALADWLRSSLFEPVSMTSATPKFDPAGHWIASSFCFCTASDFARFGELYRTDGWVGPTRLLPAGWVDHARSVTEVSEGVEARAYGAHWWLNDDGRGTFAASGYAGQHIWVVPSSELVVVRCGESTEEQRDAILDALEALVAAYD